MKKKIYFIFLFVIGTVISITVFNNANNVKTFNIERQEIFDSNPKVRINYRRISNDNAVSSYYDNIPLGSYTAPEWIGRFWYNSTDEQIRFHIDDEIITSNYGLRNHYYAYLYEYTETTQSNSNYQVNAGTYIAATGETLAETHYYKRDTLSVSTRWSVNLSAANLDPAVYGPNYTIQGGETIDIYFDMYDDSYGVDLPSNPTKDGYTFVGWYNSNNERRTELRQYYGSQSLQEYTRKNLPRDIYAKFRKNDEIICKRAKALHSETCDRTSGGCYEVGFSDDGSKGTTTITYGNLGISGQLNSGDAFTCDVNADGIYDEVEERFYYVSDYYNGSTKQFETNKAVLIYSSNTGRNGSTSSGYDYYGSSNYTYQYVPEDYEDNKDYLYPFSYGRYCEIGVCYEHNADGDYSYGKYVMSYHPNYWQTFFINNNRKITNLSGNTPYNWNVALQDYSKYSNARLLTTQELNRACNVTVGNEVVGELDDCYFLFENSTFSSSDKAANSFWLENIDDSHTLNSGFSYFVWYTSISSRMVDSKYGSNYSGFRPVIEMYKSNIEVDFETVNHTITIDGQNPVSVTDRIQYTLPSVPAKADEDVDVTLIYSNNNQQTTKAFTKQYVANGWIVNGMGYYNQHFNEGDTLTITDDLELTPDYVLVTTDSSFVFPSLPEKNTYKATNVIFKYQDGITSDEIIDIDVESIATNWKSSTISYDAADTFNRNKSMTFKADYISVGGALPNPTRDGYTFLGWYDQSEGGNHINKYDLTSNMTLYAHWEQNTSNYKCKRVGNITQYEYADSYSNPYAGMKSYFGKSGEYDYGNTFLCDVNGDGEYSSSERFIYVSDYFNTETKEFENDTAVLLYYKNIDDSRVVYSNNNSYYPNNAVSYLPSSWTNVSLKNQERQILTYKNYDMVKKNNHEYYFLDKYDYNNKNTRLLTLPEVAESCGFYDYQNTNYNSYPPSYYIDNCEYLVDGAGYYWLETLDASYPSYMQAIIVHDHYITNFELSNTAYVRPAIEVSKSEIQTDFSDTYTIEVVGKEKLGVSYGSTYTLPENDIVYGGDGSATVTFVYQDGNHSDETDVYMRQHTPNGWLINDTHYSNGISLHVTDDITANPYYNYNYSDVYFPNPSRYGYRFDGWYTDPDGGEKVEEYAEYEDITLYAHWIKVWNFYDYDGSYEEVDDGTVITLPEDDEGYDIYNYQNEYYFDFDNNNPDDYEFFPVTIYSDGVFKGWTVNDIMYEPFSEYTIHSNVDVDSIYEEVIDQSTIPDNPQRDGYAFVGWYTDPDEGELIDLNKLTQYDYYNLDSTTLYAHWVEYDPETQVVVNWDGKYSIYDKGTTIDLDVSEKRGYEEELYNVTFEPNRNTYSERSVDIIKYYTRDHYLINGQEHIDTGEYTFNEDTTIETVYSSEIIYPEVPVIEDTNFLGWYDESTNQLIASINGLMRDKTYSGKWKKVKVYIDGELSSGEHEVGLYDLPYTYRSTYSYIRFIYNQYVNYIPSTSSLWVRPIYEFDYYTVEGDDSVKYYNNELYDYEEDTYFITHYKFTGEYSGDSTFNELMNNNFDLGRTTDWGDGGTVYYLEGWYTYLGEGGVKVDLRTDPTYLIENASSSSHFPITLYANWQPLIENVNVTINDDEPYIQEFGEHQLIPSEKQVNTTKASDTFNITFDYNDGSNNRIVTQTTRNYTFECFTVDGAGCYQRDDNYTFYQDTEIKNKYTTTYTYPDIDIPEVDDPMFKGWFTKESGGMEITDVSQLEEFTDDTIIYAQYYSGTVHLNFDKVETYVPQGTIITFEDKDPFDESITLTLDYNQDGLENKTLHYITTYTLDYYQVNPIDEWFEMYPGDVYVMEKDTTITTNYNTSLRHDFVGYSENDWDYGMIYYDSDGLANQLEGWQTMVCGSGGGGIDGPKSIRNSINSLYGRDPGLEVNPGEGEGDGNCWYDYVDLDYLDFNQVEDGATITASWIRPEAQVYYYDPIDDTNVDSSWYRVGDYIDYLPEYYTKDGYYFDGWYTDDTYTERVDYDFVIKVSNLTLYGHWVEDTREDPEKSLIIKPDETTLEVEKGTIYDLGTNDISKEDDNIAEVYFVTEYYGEEAPPVYTTDYVKKRYTPNGWLVNGNYYSNLESIDCQDDIIVIRPYYDIELISPDFSEPTKDNYTFAGWYDHPETGIQYTEYIGSEDMPLFARWVGAEISVTKPDNTIEIYHYGDEYDLGTNEIEKADENVASVTFKYQDGREDTVSYVTKSFTPDKWKVNDVEEENDTVLTLTEDIVIEATYTERINELVFDEPTREHYSFDGWYDENDTELTSYNGTNDITVYAHWIGDEVTVTKPNLEVETYHYGDTYELGENEIEKASVNLGSVTFKYQDDVTADTLEYVKRKYTPSGWLVNNQEKANNQVLVLTEDIVITPNYTEEIEAVEFVDATRENYTFDGWYDEAENGNRLTSYNGNDDIEVFAHWTLSKPSDFDVDSDNLLLLVGDIHQIEATFTPDGTEDTLIYSGYDNEIISVSNEGLITALETGETEITIALESDNSITKTISVKVVHDQITSTSLDVETRDLARIIIGEEPKTTLEDFLSKLENDIEYLSVYTEDNELIEDMTIYAATGMKVKLIVDGVVQDEAVIIIRGDIDGDGLVNITDAGIMKRHIIEAQSIEGFRLYAADLDEDPEATPANMITVADSGILKRYIIEAIDSLNKKEGD